MSNIIFVCLISGVAVCVYCIYKIVHDWELIAESIDCFPENFCRLVEWHKRRALRSWNKIVCLIGGKR